MTKKTITILVIVLVTLLVILSIAWYLKRKKKTAEDVFPIKKGSTGKAVKLMQLSFDSSNLSGIWDEKLDALILEASGNSNVSYSKQDLVDFWFKPALSSPDFPLHPGSNSAYCVAVQIMLDAPFYSEQFSSATTAIVQKAIGKQEITIEDYVSMGQKIFGFTATQLAQ